MSKDIASRFDEIAKKLVKVRKSSPGADKQDTQSANRAYRTLSQSLKKHGKELKDASPKQQDAYNKVIRDTFDFLGNDHIDIEFYQKEMIKLLHQVSALSEKDGDQKITNELKDIIKAQIQSSKKDRIADGISKVSSVAASAFFNPGAIAGVNFGIEKAAHLFKGGLFSSKETNAIKAAEARGDSDKALMKEGIDTAFEKDIKHDRIEKQLHGSDGLSPSNHTHAHGTSSDKTFASHGEVNSTMKTMNVENLIVKNFVNGAKTARTKAQKVVSPKPTIKTKTHTTEEGFSQYKPKSAPDVTDVEPNPLKLSNKVKPKYDTSNVTDVEPKIKAQKLLGNSVPITDKIKAAQGAIPAAEGSMLSGGAITAGMGTLAAGAVVVGGGMALDYGMGKLGVGGHDIDENRDDANWDKMSLMQKAQSGSARAIEHAGSFVGLGNISNEAKHNRIEKESEYFKKNSPQIEPSPIDVDSNVEKMKKGSDVTTKNLESEISKNVSYKDSSNTVSPSQPIIVNNNNAAAPQPRNPEPTGRPAAARHSDSTFKRWQDNSFFS